MQLERLKEQQESLPMQYALWLTGKSTYQHQLALISTMKWMKLQWFKVRSTTRSRLSVTHHATKSSRWASKIIRWSESPCNQSGRKAKGLWRKDLLKSQVLSSEWNTEQVREAASGDSEDGEDDELPCVIGESAGDCVWWGLRRSVGSSLHRQGAAYLKEWFVIFKEEWVGGQVRVTIGSASFRICFTCVGKH